MGGGAWPFLVGGVICLVNSVNERDLNLLNSHANPATQNQQVSVVQLVLLFGVKSVVPLACWRLDW